MMRVLREAVATVIGLTTGQRTARRWPEGMVIYDTEIDALFVGDGRTLGGRPAVVRVTSSTGNVVIDASSGDVSLSGRVRGTSAPFAFAAATVTPASDADVTLTESQYACPILIVNTGAWTSGHNVIVPAVVGVYFVRNASSYTATVKTASGTGVSVATNKSQVLYCDGTNVVALSGV